MPENILTIQAVGRLRQSILLNLSQGEIYTTIFIHLNKEGLDKQISKHDVILTVLNPITQWEVPALGVTGNFLFSKFSHWTYIIYASRKKN